VTSFRIPNLAAISLLMIFLVGCDDSARIAKSQEIARCYNPFEVYVGTSLEERRKVFSRRAELTKGCTTFNATNEVIPASSFSIDAFPVGFWPQGIEITPEEASFGIARKYERQVFRKNYEETFEKNYPDYIATIKSSVPNTCIGSDFYGCVKRLSQYLRVSTGVMDNYIYEPSRWRDEVIPTAGANVTVENPNRQRLLGSNGVFLRLLSKSSAKITDSIVLTFDLAQNVSIERMSAKDMEESDLYEVFSGLSDKCKAMDKRDFYDSIVGLMAISHTAKTDIKANGYSASVNTVSLSKKSLQLCGMKVRVKREGGAYVDWHRSGEGSHLKLLISR
jgi:hypothetical protein